MQNTHLKTNAIHASNGETMSVSHWPLAVSVLLDGFSRFEAWSDRPAWGAEWDWLPATRSGHERQRAVVKTATMALSPPKRGLKPKDVHCGFPGGEPFDPSGFPGQFGLGLTDQGTGVRWR